MGFTEVIDRARQTVRVTAEGRIDLADIRGRLDREIGERTLGYRELIDARAATTALTPDDVRVIVDTLRRLGRRTLGPTAVVVSSEYAFGMLRMLEIMASDVADIRPFRTLEEAEAWLAATAPRSLAEGD